MYQQYRNLPPRHQPPGLYPPHQPSLRQQGHHHSGYPYLQQPQPAAPRRHQIGSHRLTRSQSHEPYSNHHPHPRSHHAPPHSSSSYLEIHDYRYPAASRSYSPTKNRHSPISPISTTTSIAPSGVMYHHHVVSPTQSAQSTNSQHSAPPTVPVSPLHATASTSTTTATTSIIGPTTATPDAIYAIQQMQRIKAATACQIINNRVVEAIRKQQQQKLEKEKEKAIKRRIQKISKEDNGLNYLNKIDTESDSNDDTKQSQYIENNKKVDIREIDISRTNMLTIPQLEISTAPKSTANITNLTDEELKMNPELYKMYSYYIPYAYQQQQQQQQQQLIHHSIGPRNRNKKHLNEETANSYLNGSHSRSHSTDSSKKQAKLVPIGKPKPNPLETNPPNPIISKSATKHKLYKQPKENEEIQSLKLHPLVAPAHANVQSVISPNGG
eukprot:486647_1